MQELRVKNATDYRDTYSEGFFGFPFQFPIGFYVNKAKGVRQIESNIIVRLNSARNFLCK